MEVSCAPVYHRHVQRCAKCGVADLTVASTTRADGTRWPPTCASCSGRVQRVTK